MTHWWNKLVGNDEGDEAARPKEESAALLALRAAAERGEAGAQTSLGDMYYNGESVVQDYAAAAKWYRLAAEQGQVAARFQLGNMYRVGLGVLQSQAEAARWLKLAAEQGDPAAQALLGKIAAPELGGSREFNEGIKQMRAAAEHGQPGAQLILAAMHETGNGVAQDPDAALAWVELALAQLAPGPLREAGLRQQARLMSLLTPADQARARQMKTQLRHVADD